MDSRIAFHGKVDNYYFLPYNWRILDALANIFHIKTDCAAIFIYKDILYLSYNSQIRPNNTEARNSIELIYRVISSGLNRESLTLYLLLNESFIKFIKNQHRYECKIQGDEDFKNQLAFFKERHAVLMNKLKTNITQSEAIDPSCMEIKDAYFGIIDSLKQYNTLLRSKKKKDIEVKEQILRPMQDVEKVLYSMKNGYSIAGYRILDNKEGLHAEYNITLHFPFVDKANNYIGVTKLCCGFCHQYLMSKGYKHRGTHGVCDGNWDMLYSSPQFEDFKTKVLFKSTRLDLTNQPFEWRRLSTDNFEKLIAQSEQLGNLEQRSELHKLKKDLGLNPSCGKAISDFFDSLGSSINYCCSKFSNIISGQYTEVSDPSPSEQPLIGSNET